MAVEVIATPKAPLPSASAPYSQAIRVGELVYTCGQLPLDPETGKLVEGGMEAQTEQTLRNLKHVLEAAGSGMDKLVKVSVFLRNRSDWPVMNEVYSRHVGSPKPARSALTVGDMAQDALIEIEAVGWVGE